MRLITMSELDNQKLTHKKNLQSLKESLQVCNFI